MKPYIIYISGPPGSGKSTLALRISDHLLIPHISSDLLNGGLDTTAPGHDRGQAYESIFIPMLRSFAAQGISCVVDNVLQKHLALPSTFDKITPYANIVYIHLQASDPIARYTARVSNSQSPNIIGRKKMLLDRADYHRSNMINTATLIDVDVPSITVVTDQGYEPVFEDIIAFIQDNVS